MRDFKGRYVPGEPEHPDYRFKPGQSGNPAGRPRGSRSKLLECVVGDFYVDWVDHGAKVIAKPGLSGSEIRGPRMSLRSIRATR